MTARAKIPAHVAIIMDGNGRWAQARGKERGYGHAQGAESVRECLKGALKAGVKYITFYAFSTENWGRPREEVDMLMGLLCENIVRESGELQKQGVRIIAIGDREALPPNVREHLARIEDETSQGSGLTAVLAVNYSSREEIARAAERLAARAAKGELKERITPGDIEANLYTAGIPDPDLLIRTGGEQRLSNFLLWQAAYAELYFTHTMWPDFGEADFGEAIEEYARRERRFGLTAEQI